MLPRNIFDIRMYKMLFSLSLVSQLFLLSHCSSSQQGSQQGEPVNGLDNTAATNASLNGGNPKNAAKQGEGMNNAVSSGGTNNFGSNPGSNPGANPASAQGGNLGFGNNPAAGEGLNNVPMENPAALTSNLPANIPVNQAAIPLSQTATTGNPAAELPPVNTAGNPATPPVNSAATPAAAPAADPGARFAASPFQNPQMNWPGKGKVKYVTRQVTKHSAPNGPVVGEYAQGEHPLVYQNGNWVELNDGSFVKGNGLTDSPLGYPKKKAGWR